MTKLSHIGQLVELGLWDKEIAQRVDLLGGKDKVELMLRARHAIQSFENLRSNPLTMQEVVPIVSKARQHTKNRRQAVAPANEERQQIKQRRKAIALKIAALVLGQKGTRTLRLPPGKLSQLAKKIMRRWPGKEGPIPGLRTIRRWLTEDAQK